MAKVDLLNDKYDFAGNCANGTVTKNTTGDIDFKLPETLKVSGGEILTDKAIHGDTLVVQIVDVDGIDFEAGTVLKTYITKWGHDSITQKSILDNSYAGEIKKDYYLRVKFTSTGTTDDVKVVVNYYLHKEV